jgi:hypothetical protein
MKTSLLLPTLVATVVASASFAAPNANQAATLNSAAAMQHHIENLHKYGGPKANPGIAKGGVKVPTQVGGAAGNAAFYDDYCGNGKKPIPGVGPVPGLSPAGSQLAMNEVEPCGTRVPGRIPGLGPIGPR